MRFSTEIGDKTVTLQCRDDLEPQANGMLGHLKRDFASQSERLKDGFKIQWGWSVLRLRDRTPDLVLCEPNFRGNPFMEWNDDVSTTISVLLQQVGFLRSIEFPGSNCVPARFDDKIVLSRGCLSNQRIYLERIEVSRGRPGMVDDSGWYIGPVPPSGKTPDYQAMRVYELLHLRPAALQVLELPPGFLVVLDGDQIEGIEENRRPPGGSTADLCAPGATDLNTFEGPAGPAWGRRVVSPPAPDFPRPWREMVAPWGRRASFRHREPRGTKADFNRRSIGPRAFVPSTL